jgi:3D (Asp-Asp-Asp) domain-containing protein
MQNQKLVVILNILTLFLLSWFYILYISEDKTPQQTIIHQSQSENLTCSISAYTNHPQETNHDNNHTAIMEEPIAGYTCAVSQDLIHWLGGTIYIKGIGIRKVNDLMNKRFKKSIDLYMGTVKQAKEFGRQDKQVIFLGR